MLSDSFHHLQIVSEHIFGLVSVQRLQDYKSTLLSGLSGSLCSVLCDLANIWEIFLYFFRTPANITAPNCTGPVCYLWLLFSHISAPLLINWLQRLWLWNVNMLRGSLKNVLINRIMIYSRWTKSNIYVQSNISNSN